MATKANEDRYKPKHFVIDYFHSDESNKFLNINLNQTNKYSNNLSHSNSKLNNNQKSGYTVTDNNHENGKAWNKTTKDLSFKTLKNPSWKNKAKETQKQWIMKEPSNINNNSTLSLHIAAYENSFEVISSEIEPKKFTTLKSDDSFSKLQTNHDILEYPRQMEDNKKSTTPQIMQFKVSQKFFSPNQSASSSKLFCTPKPSEQQISMDETPQDDEESRPETSAKKSRKRKQTKPSDGLTAFQRAQKQYEKIQGERREEAKKRRIENERRENERLEAMSFRRRKDQALKSRTKKGQPNLNAVMGCIVEKLMKEKEKKK